MSAKTLFRPVGIRELELILAADSRAFPPRLPEQPIFYPVLNQSYAAQIARDWNASGEHRAGFVTRFEVEQSYVSRFQEQTVGARRHRELWVPAEELAEFNRHITDRIRVVAAFFGDEFEGCIASSGRLAGMDARTQLETLSDLDDALLADEIRHHAVPCQANYLYWRHLSKVRTLRDQAAR
ncbi:MAG TPA: hypothetical protein VKU80_05340 [Planctomycetota bacterium]|nr:hypothetical protein [Planctomycetota bacterium]